MGHARGHFEGLNLSSSRFVVSAFYYGFFHLVCYMVAKAATTVLAKDSCNRQIRRAIQAERCSRARNLAAGLALIIASPVILAQEPLHDIDIPSLNAAQALSDSRTGFWKR